MENLKNINLDEYAVFLSEIKETIRIKQLEAFRSVNRVLIEVYWLIGQKIVENNSRR